MICFGPFLPASAGHGSFHPRLAHVSDRVNLSCRTLRRRFELDYAPPFS